MTEMNQDQRETRLKRLKIRSWRRGTREMDMLLGPFADSALPDLDDADLDAYEAILDENDWDLYAWLSGGAPMAEAHAPILRQVADFHGIARS
jgi:antitoxin CptB